MSTSDSEIGLILRQLYLDLKSRRVEFRARAARDIRTILEIQAREHGSERAQSLFVSIARDMLDLVNSVDPCEQLGCLEVITELVEWKCEFQETMIGRFKECFRRLFDLAPSNPDIVLETAAKAIAHVATTGIVQTLEFASEQIEKALETIETLTRSVTRYRLAAVLILKELALSCPTIFSSYVDTFMRNIWYVLRDPHPRLRAEAVNALRVVLHSVKKPVAEQQRALYKNFYEMALSTLRAPQAPMWATHGSLLGMGELLIVPFHRNFCIVHVVVQQLVF